MVSEPDTERCTSEEAKPKGANTRRCASKNARPRRGWIRGSYIDWRRELVPARTLGPEGGSWGGQRNIFYKGVEPLPSRHVLKTLRGSTKRKAQREQYLLAVAHLSIEHDLYYLKHRTWLYILASQAILLKYWIIISYKKWTLPAHSTFLHALFNISSCILQHFFMHSSTYIVNNSISEPLWFMACLPLESRD